MQTGKLWTAAGGFNIERSSPLKLIDNANRDAPRHTVYPALPRHCAQRRSRSAAARRSSCDSRTNKPLEDSWRRHHGTRTVVVAGERLHVYVTFVMAWGVAHNRPFPDVLFPEGWFIYTWLAVYAATGWGLIDALGRGAAGTEVEWLAIIDLSSARLGPWLNARSCAWARESSSWRSRLGS